MLSKKVTISVGIFVIAVAIFAGVFHMTVNRIYVKEGHSLQLQYLGSIFGTSKAAAKGEYAKIGEQGTLKQMYGPGRHFYCPIWWKGVIVPDVIVKPGEVAIVTSQLGEPLPGKGYLVDGKLGETNHKGIMRKAYGPGRYRLNPYAYTYDIIQLKKRPSGKQVKHSGWVEIPTGYVGVVTYQTDNPLLKKVSDIQAEVLPPGLYPVNPHEQQIDIVEVGFRETSITVEKMVDTRGKVKYDASGEPLAVPESGIGFPSNDGFEIQLDFTAIWGVMPSEAPEVIRTFGSISAAEQKVILPQSESICRNNGSKMGAVELLVGESRQQFQLDTSKSFQNVLADKNITLLYGLVRHIYIPQEVREPIQKGYIADELKLTREQETKTAKTEANLREEERKVELESEKILVETEKLVANVLAEGEKTAREIDAETKQLVAQVDKKIADLDAQKTVTIGQAQAETEKLRQEAMAKKFKLAVEAFGDPTAYNKWQFAQGLPDPINLQLFYAGKGTLWTDLKNILPTLPLRPDETGAKAKLEK